MGGGPSSSGAPQDALPHAEPIRTMIVDDHALFRRGLEMVLEGEPDIDLVGQASDGAEAVEKAAESLPDIVLMDIRMPRSNGIEACRAVKGGQSLINPSMAGKLLTEFAALARRDDEERAQEVPAPRLTEREMQVLKLVARGMNNRDIAKELFISENTVKNHVRNILEKLQIHSRMEAVMVAVREKLIEFS